MFARKLRDLMIPRYIRHLFKKIILIVAEINVAISIPDPNVHILKYC